MKSVGEFDFAVFDCDGVLLDSNTVKTNAFRHALNDYPAEKVDALVAYHREHGGVSRYDKFRYFFQSLLGDANEQLCNTALQRFQAFCQRELASTPIIPGALDFLDSLLERNMPMFVVSGSDQTELRMILEKKQLARYFHEILGSPVSKRDNLEHLLAKHAPTGCGVYFGDARLDFEIATERGLDFVYVFGFSDWNDGKAFCAKHNLVSIPDFRCL